MNRKQLFTNTAKAVTRKLVQYVIIGIVASETVEFVRGGGRHA